MRYIPSVPLLQLITPSTPQFDEVEICNNYTLVKVSAPQALLDTIDADPDFQSIPRLASIPANLRTRIRNKLLALGYDAADIDAANWNAEELLRLLPRLVHNVALSADKRSVVVGARRNGSGKNVDMIDKRLPG